MFIQRKGLLILVGVIIFSCQLPSHLGINPQLTPSIHPANPISTPVGEATLTPSPLTSPEPASTPFPTRSPPPTLATNSTRIFLPSIENHSFFNSKPRTETDDRPNIVIILSDDQRYDTMEFMPLTRELIFEAGMTFTHGYVTTSSCCPSRASLFTGQYAHNHGVHVNQDPLEERTFIEDLHTTGYYTGLVGKYLNSWDGSMRPEFDFWVSFEGGSSPYYDPRFNVQGKWKDREGYITYLLRDYALKFLEKAQDQDRPFLLIFTPNAPHDPADPAPGDEELYTRLPPYRPPNFNEKDVSDKPEWVKELSLLSHNRIESIDEFRREQLQTLNALDQVVESIMLKLEAAGELDHTFVVYLSDNGYFWGEHRRRRGKGDAYEESILVPFAVRYPPLVAEARIEDRLVANIDLAPTIYQLAGLSIPPDVDGYSLIPLLEGLPGWRDKLFVENWIQPGHYIGIRTSRYLYVEWDNFAPELYDMRTDPYQLENQANNPEYIEIVSNFHLLLEGVRAKKD